jgi:hypothetical protein
MSFKALVHEISYIPEALSLKPDRVTVERSDLFIVTPSTCPWVL